MTQADTFRVRRKRPRQFAQVPYGIARDPTLSDKALRLWVVLESYADYNDRDCYPSMDTLAGHLNCHRATIARAVKELTLRGLLEVASGQRAGASNNYILVDPEPPGCSTHATPPTAPTRDPGGAPMRHKREPAERNPSNETLVPVADAPGGTDSTIDQLCRYLADAITHHRGTGSPPAITQQWRKDMDLLLRRGARGWDPPKPLSPGYIRQIISGLFAILNQPEGGNSTFCWADQVQSPGNLRKNFDRIILAGRAKLKLATRDPLASSADISRNLFDNTDPLLPRGTK